MNISPGVESVFVGRVCESGGHRSCDVTFEEPVRSHRPRREALKPQSIRQPDAVPTHCGGRLVATDEQRRDEHRHSVHEAGFDERPVERASPFE